MSMQLQSGVRGAARIDVAHDGLPKIVSLFSGAGGLDLGFTKAGYEVVLAVDSDQWAIETHRQAFPHACNLQADLIKLGAKGLLDKVRPLLTPGERIGVIGGPPCQGFSRSNVTATANDPRNKLPMVYLKIVEALQAEYQVEFLIFENVLGIRDRKHENTFTEILRRLRKLGLHPDVDVYDAFDFGVPQHRQRVIIAAFASDEARQKFVPIRQITGKQTVSQAIGRLPEPSYFSRGMTPNRFHPNHWTMQPRSHRFSNHDERQSDGRSFRRLKEDEPSPTVAYGHREIHVHPSGRRRLSILEAMLLQGFTRKFVLYGPFSSQVQQVSNAVPPPFAFALAQAVACSLGAAEE